MIFFLSYPFFTFDDLLTLRQVSKEIEKTITNRYPKEGTTFLEKVRTIHLGLDWKTDKGEMYSSKTRIKQLESFRLFWSERLPPIFPFHTWPSFFRYFFPCMISSWTLTRFGQRTRPLFSRDKQHWKIRVKLTLKYFDYDETDIIAVGLTTDPSVKFVGMDQESIGYHCDDGLICFDSSILRRLRKTGGFESVVLELDYREGIVRFYQENEEIYWTFLHGGFLCKPLYIMVSGYVEHCCSFDIEIF